MQKTSHLLIVLGKILIMSCVQVLLCDESTSLLTPALVSFRVFNSRERKRKILKDEKKHHSTVDESSSEQVS